MSESSLAIVLVAFTMLFLCAFWFAPGGVLALRSLAGGELQVDVRLGYSPKTLFRLLDLYGPAGRRSFRAMLLVDMVFPALYGATLFLLGDLLRSAAPHAASLALVAQCAAIAAAGLDYLENLFLLHVLRHLGSRPQRSARLAGVSTSLKMVAFLIAAASLAVGCLIAHEI